MNDPQSIGINANENGNQDNNHDGFDRI